MEENRTETGGRRKIIYVDDVNIMLLSIKSRLKSHYEVYPAQSAEKMFEILANIKPDLILLDIGMPDPDGYEIIKQLKANEGFADIPVIFLTGKTDRNSVIKALNLGAADILFKPITDAKLIERIDYQFNPDSQTDNKPIILAVDDSPSILKAVNSALNDKYKVYTVPAPELVTEILKKLTPDLFLLDCHMPKLNGFDLIDIIRKFPLHQETPIVFLTSERDRDTVLAAVGFGVCDYIGKPIDETVLRERIAARLKDFTKRRIIRSLER